MFSTSGHDSTSTTSRTPIVSKKRDAKSKYLQPRVCNVPQADVLHCDSKEMFPMSTATGRMVSNEQAFCQLRLKVQLNGISTNVYRGCSVIKKTVRDFHQKQKRKHMTSHLMKSTSMRDKTS